MMLRCILNGLGIAILSTTVFQQKQSGSMHAEPERHLPIRLGVNLHTGRLTDMEDLLHFINGSNRLELYIKEVEP